MKENPLEEQEQAFDQLTAINVRTALDRVVNWLGKYVSWIIFFSMSISVFEVVMRYVFNSPTRWVHETTTFLVAIAFVLSGSFTLARDRHIRVHALYDLAGPKVQKILDIISHLFSMLYFAGLIWAGWYMFKQGVFSPSGEFLLERSGSSWNPPFPAFIKITILVTASVMFVQSTLHLLQEFMHSNKTSQGDR